MATLEQLTHRASQTATLGDYTLVRSRIAFWKYSTTRPDELDDADIGVLRFFGGDKALAEARSAREVAMRRFDVQAAPVAAARDESLEVYGSVIVKLVEFTESMNERNKERNAKITALEEKIAELEARPAGMPYKGIWSPGEAYREGELATLAGSLWHCRALTYSRPGTDSTWQLCVKKGQA